MQIVLLQHPRLLGVVEDAACFDDGEDVAEGFDFVLEAFGFVGNCLPSRRRSQLVSVSRAMFWPDHSAIRSVLIVARTSRPCCSAVRITLARIDEAFAPAGR